MVFRAIGAGRLSAAVQLIDVCDRVRVGPIEDSPESKIGRVSEKSGSPRKHPYTFEDEIRVYREFKKAARPYLNSDPRSEIEWLAIAQHHGLPTRLLDWSASVLVAAFFAVEKAGKAEGVMYAVRDIDEIDEGRQGLDEKQLYNLGSVKLYRPPHISPRIPVQQSVFSVHPPPTEKFSHPSLETWHIDAGACWGIKRSLSAAAVTQACLFPDVDGISRHLAWLYKWSYFDGFDATRS